MKYVVIGSPSGVGMDYIMSVYPRHKVVIDRLVQDGALIGVGPFVDRGNMAIFRSREAAERFVAEDPFLKEGVVGEYTIREWDDGLLA